LHVWTRKDPIWGHKKERWFEHARNVEIEKSLRCIITLLDADDKLQNHIEKELKLLMKVSGVKVVYCEAEKFGEESGKWHLPILTIDLVNYNMIFILERKEWL
jgi:hypothetical protein